MTVTNRNQKHFVFSNLAKFSEQVANLCLYLCCTDLSASGSSRIRHVSLLPNSAGGVQTVTSRAKESRDAVRASDVGSPEAAGTNRARVSQPHMAHSEDSAGKIVQPRFGYEILCGSFLSDRRNVAPRKYVCGRPPHDTISRRQILMPFRLYSRPPRFYAKLSLF